MSKPHSLLNKDGELLESPISVDSDADSGMRMLPADEWSADSGAGLILEVANWNSSSSGSR